MNNKSIFKILGLLIAISILLAACGPQNVTEAPAGEEPAGEEPAAEEPSAGGGDIFIFGRGADSVQLDPALVTDGESFRVTGQVLEPLYQYELGSTVPIPALAEECVANEDATVWTCSLREGVKFHDGTDFNADAVVFNFERWRFTDNPFHFESQTFEYYEYMWGGFDDDSMITEVAKVDDLTVQFTLSAPLAPFLANLAMDMFAINSPAAVEAAGEAYGTPSVGAVGTGPFKFVSWQEGTEIIIEANEDYWGGAPKVDQVVFKVIPDDSARFLALQAGDIHGLEQAVVEDLATAEASDDLYIITRPALNTGYLAFNYKIVEFQDPLVRQAVAHAIDKEGLIANFYGKYGEAATNFLPPLIWGHNDDIVDYEYDADLARELLAEAGFPDGLSEVTIAEDIVNVEGAVLYEAGEKVPLRLYYMPVTRFYYPSPEEIGTAMAANLNAAGFGVELYLEGDWPTYLAGRSAGTLVGLYMLGWGGDNGDPDNFTGYFFGQAAEPLAKEGWYANPELSALLQEAAVTPDREAREEMYKEAEQIMHDEVTRIWIAHNNTPLIFSSAIQGYGAQPVGADYFEFVEFVD